MQVTNADLTRITHLFEDRFINLTSTYKPNKHTTERLKFIGYLREDNQLSAKAIQEVLSKTPYRMILMKKMENTWEKLDRENDRWVAATKQEVTDFINKASSLEGKFSQSGEIYIFTYREK